MIVRNCTLCSYLQIKQYLSIRVQQNVPWGLMVYGMKMFTLQVVRWRGCG